MALRSDYTDGTISIAAGGTTVTGSGTAWKSLAVRAGDTIMVKGLVVAVTEDPTSETALTIDPWPGVALANAAYRLRFQSDADRLTATARALVVALENGNLAAIADLESTADTVPYFTGSGAAALTGLTAFGRSLLAAANVDAVLPGRLGTIATIVTNWNDAKENGWFMGSAAANAPEATGWFLGYVEAHGAAGFFTQTVHSFTSDGDADTRLFRRSCNGGVWSDWYRCRISEAEQQALWDARYLGIAAKAADSAHADTATAAGSATTAANATKLGGQLPAYYWSDGRASQSLGFNGYQKLPSGLFVQWGEYTGGGDSTIQFPIAFPSNLFSFVATFDGVPTTTEHLLSIGVSAKSRSGVTVRPRYLLAANGTVNMATQPIFWMAVGN